MTYVWNLLRAIDQLGNAILAGNSRQTLSSRFYEGGVVRNIWYWWVGYIVVDVVAYALRWLFARPLGYRWGEDMPRNHCKDAYLAFPELNTYG